MSGIRPRWPEAVSSLSMSILLFLEVLDAVPICMAPVSWHASRHPAGLVRGLQPPALAAGASIPPFQGAFRCWGKPPHLRRSTGVLVTFHLAVPLRLARQA